MRKIASTLVAVACVLGVLGGAPARAAHANEQPKKHKIAYQLTEPDKAHFVLGNIQNHIKGVGGWQNIEALELVVFGPALKVFTTGADPEIRKALEALQAQGLTFGACGNTMRGMKITLEQLPKGTEYLPQGGVVRLMELQEQGYSYIRP